MIIVTLCCSYETKHVVWSSTFRLCFSLISFSPFWQFRICSSQKYTLINGFYYMDLLETTEQKKKNKY